MKIEEKYITVTSRQLIAFILAIILTISYAPFEIYADVMGGASSQPVNISNVTYSNGGDGLGIVGWGFSVWTIKS